MRGKIILPIAVLLVVGMILFPLPSHVLDGLLAANFAFCIVLLLSSLFVSEPDRFTSLPSVLLLSTLFRLGLNVSSTRVILGGSGVPEIIIAFGQFTVAGSTIVGLVIFAIISIIQFLVIAKGSERVAEVAARFTLDALPGKQMSIDADMRAGLLTLSEARQKRRELHRESKLYGALDGAMKFIKGDAIVGLFIIFVNIVAGFIVGVSRDGLTLLKAIEQYTLYTIGDGLVSQIPAVLVSTAAGIVVTRVSEKEGGQLSEEIVDQLTSEPIPLLVGGVVLFCLACVPGLPFLPFGTVGCIAMFLWRRKIKAAVSLESPQEEFPFQPRIMSPIAVRLSAKAAQLLQQEGRIGNYFDALRSVIFEDFGVILPDLTFDIDPIEKSITSEILISGQMCQKIRFLPEKAIPGCLDSWSRCLGTALKQNIQERVIEFVTDSHTRNLLDMYEQKSIDSIRTLIPDKISITGITLIMKALVEEGLCIRDIGLILQSLSELFELSQSGIEESLNVAVRRSRVLVGVRKKLMRPYLAKLLSGSKKLKGVILEEDLLERISSHVTVDLPLHPEIARELRAFVQVVFDELGNSDTPLIVLVPSSIRYVVSQSLGKSLKGVIVMADEEVPEEFTFEICNHTFAERLSEAA